MRIPTFFGMQDFALFKERDSEFKIKTRARIGTESIHGKIWFGITGLGEIWFGITGLKNPIGGLQTSYNQAKILGDWAKMTILVNVKYINKNIIY